MVSRWALVLLLGTGGGAVGLIANASIFWLLALAAAIAVVVVAIYWGYPGLVKTLLVASLLPLPTVSIRTALVGVGTAATPILVAAGIATTQRRGVSAKLPFGGLYLAFLSVAGLSVLTSWVFWDPRVATGEARGYGHRWIGYQLAALFFLAAPFLALAGGYFYGLLQRDLRRLYGWVLAGLAVVSMIGLASWIQHPVNPIVAYQQGARPTLDSRSAVLLVVLALALSLYERRLAIRVLAGALLALGLADTFVAYALNGWLAVLTAVTILVWYRWRGRGLAIWLACLAALVLTTESTIATIVNQRSTSTDIDRVGLWQSALFIWGNHPILGVGPGNLPSYMETYNAFPLALVLQGYQEVHNIFLELLAELGIAGMSIFVGFLGLLTRTLARKLPPSSPDALLPAAGLALLLAAATMASLGGGFVPTIGSAGWDALPSVLLVWFLAGTGASVVLLASTSSGAHGTGGVRR